MTSRRQPLSRCSVRRENTSCSTSRRVASSSGLIFACCAVRRAREFISFVTSASCCGSGRGGVLAAASFDRVARARARSAPESLRRAGARRRAAGCGLLRARAVVSGSRSAISRSASSARIQPRGLSCLIAAASRHCASNLSRGALLRLQAVQTLEPAPGERPDRRDAGRAASSSRVSSYSHSSRPRGLQRGVQIEIQRHEVAHVVGRVLQLLRRSAAGATSRCACVPSRACGRGAPPRASRSRSAPDGRAAPPRSACRRSVRARSASRVAMASTSRSWRAACSTLMRSRSPRNCHSGSRSGSASGSITAQR